MGKDKSSISPPVGKGYEGKKITRGKKPLYGRRKKTCSRTREVIPWPHSHNILLTGWRQIHPAWRERISINQIGGRIHAQALDWQNRHHNVG